MNLMGQMATCMIWICVLSLTSVLPFFKYDTFGKRGHRRIIKVLRIQLYNKLDLFVIITMYFMKPHMDILPRIQNEYFFKCLYKYSFFSLVNPSGLEEVIDSLLMLPH